MLSLAQLSTSLLCIIFALLGPSSNIKSVQTVQLQCQGPKPLNYSTAGQGAKLPHFARLNYNLVESWDGYILNIPIHPPTGEVRNDLWNEAYNSNFKTTSTWVYFALILFLVHPPTHKASGDKLQLHLQIPFQLQV